MAEHPVASTFQDVNLNGSCIDHSLSVDATTDVVKALVPIIGEHVDSIFVTLAGYHSNTSVPPKKSLGTTALSYGICSKTARWISDLLQNLG